jgi:VCBS repeat-containing protein
MNYRVDKPMLDALMNGASIGDEFELTIARDQLMRKVIVKITGQKKSSFIFTNRHTDASLPLYSYWLR